MTWVTTEEMDADAKLGKKRGIYTGNFPTLCQLTFTKSRSTEDLQWRIQEGARDARAFFHFHAVFGKNFAK